MKHKLKKFVSIVVFAGILFSSLEAKATNVIQDIKKRTNIASGVQHVKIDRFTDAGWIDIDVLKLDTKNDFSKLTPLFGAEGVSKRSTLSSMINSKEALAGINGDFFETSKYPMALGSLYGDDKLILSTPELAFSRNSFYITKDGTSGVGNLKNTIVAKNLSKGIEYNINAINKLSRPYSAISILDNNWGKESPGNSLGSGNVEVLIVNNLVVDKRVGGVPFPILPGTHILVQVGKDLDNLSIGDRVEIDFGSYTNLNFAIGGGNILVNKGNIPDNKSFSTTRTPRTAIGINSSNSEILLVTVDGRNNSSIGMTELELANFMKSIGAHNALNLDGGGSTTMGIRYSGDQITTVVNSPSEGSERAIVSGVGIKTNAPISEPSYIKIKPSDTNTFIGFSYPISVEIFDQYHNKLDVSPESISLSSDLGNIKDLNFNPTTKGKGSINASYQNADGSVNIFVHSEIRELILDVGFLQLNSGQNHIFETIYGKDDLGYKKIIHSSQVIFSASEGIGNFEDNQFIAQGESGRGIITANYNGIIRNIPVSIGTQKAEVFSFDNIDNAKLTLKPDDDTKITANLYLDEESQDGTPSTGLVYSLAADSNPQVAEIAYEGGIDLGTADYIGLWIKGDSSGAKLTAVFKDDSGRATITDLVANLNFGEWKYIEAKIPCNLKGNISLEKIILTVNEEKELISTILLDGLVAGVKLPLDWESATGSNVTSDPGNYLPEGEVTSKISILSLNKNGGDNTQKLNHLQNKNVAVVFNGASAETLATINAGMKFNGNDTHNIKTSNGITFISLEINDYGIRSANSSQWKPFISTMESVDHKNIVIMLQKNPENIRGNKEKTFFFNIIEKAVKSGKNIFILSPGNSNSVEWLNGYRKVSLTGYGNSALDINIKDGNLSYVLTRLE